MEVCRTPEPKAERDYWNPCEANKTQIIAVIEKFAAYKDIDLEKHLKSKDDPYDYVMAVLQANADQKGLIQDLITFLDLMGIPYKPILFVK